MLRIAICDDEQSSVEELYLKIQNAADELLESAEIHRFTSGSDILKSQIKFNLIFLDIEMPETDGIETAEKIRSFDSQVQIVYVTNYRDFMKKAYSVHAFDYIQKPADSILIKKVIEDYLKILNPAKSEILKFNSLMSENIYIAADEIVYISCGAKKRTIIVITENSEYICKGKITEIYKTLDSMDFFMPHRSHIINLSFVRSFKRNEKIIMINGDEIPLSKGNSADFEKQLARKMHQKTSRREL